jgi:uroporphyrinogen decarboxylase
MDWNTIPDVGSKPDFDNVLCVLRREVPQRPTLFEFFLNDPLYARLVPDWPVLAETPEGRIRGTIRANLRLGYDYTTLVIPGFALGASHGPRRKDRSVSMNEGSLIHTRADFEAFPWPDPDTLDYELLDRLGGDLPDGMKLIPYGPGGVLENVVDLVGYEALCLLIYDDAPLAQAIFDAVGSRLVRYYERAVGYASVGACISNDDWGFKTQTMFAPQDMRRLVFPWHTEIVKAIHAGGKPAILHSCGHYGRIIEDVIEDMKFDGRHSYEDGIQPVEAFYEQYGSRIAVLGGIDLDFVCRAAPEEVYRRSKAMLERAAGRGGFALGTGNSVPDYVPDANYFAMLRAALEVR